MEFKEIWDKLYNIDINKHIKKRKDGYSYLPWVNAWILLQTYFPGSTYEILKDGNNRPYFIDDFGAFVQTKVTIEGYTLSMQLHVFDNKMKPMKPNSYSYKTANGEKFVNAIDSGFINKTIMRCLTKNIALFGLGIKLWQDEDLLDEHEEEIPWSELRKTLKVGGNGENKNKTWAEVDPGYLTWCINPANKKFTKRLKPLAEKEIEFRKNEIPETQMKTIDDMPEDLKSEAIQLSSIIEDMASKSVITSGLKDWLLSELLNTSTEEGLEIIKQKCAVLNEMYQAVKDRRINTIKYKLNLAIIKSINTTTENLESLLSKLKKLKPSKDNFINLLDDYRDKIEKTIEELGELKYDQYDNEKRIVNSNMKNLGVNNVFACDDINKLKKYYDRLQTKLEIAKNTTKRKHKEKIKNEVENNEEEAFFNNKIPDEQEPDPTSDVPFGNYDKKQTNETNEDFELG